jgi:hypothetical protein
VASRWDTTDTADRAGFGRWLSSPERRRQHHGEREESHQTGRKWAPRAWQRPTPRRPGEQTILHDEFMLEIDRAGQLCIEAIDERARLFVDQARVPEEAA